ncbi:hypothetical protein EZV62_022663 [Acer yangbiense]|uniref:Retrovirus-related Pol polyprotein from transposon TNT 1-94-like beta-barrel domain-containing protein n=1 Tax=Acer yangbiense TaxID=1000413 RepID=A0A5C7H964_9ROSI|nr:hypothetical protein EZV62_022663 [Acer yangbiense]
MGNNMSCKVVGIDTVRIKMFDGIIRTLFDVRHVLDLKKNLISLGTIDSQGYKYSSECGVMRGNTFIGVIAVSSLSDPDSDITRLWHMSLGHMSGADMTIWSKQSLFDGQKTDRLEF